MKPEMKIENEKLQKILARAGLGSRREIEEWIKQGRIEVNRQTAKLGDRASLNDEICLDRKKVKLKGTDQLTRQILLYHKPIGEVCTRSDPEGRPTIFDHLPKLQKGKWIAIGRLDINTCGLILLTNDGDFANEMMHPSNEFEREYAVRVFGEVTDDMIERLKRGVKLDDGFAKFNEIKKQGGDGINQWYRVMIKEGRKREVRRLWESQGLKVSRLIRVRFGDYELPKELNPGEWMVV